MKSSFIRASVLVLVLGLAACGGKATFEVAGTMTGLSFPGLVLSNNGADLAVAPAATTFSFPNQIDYGTAYSVTVKAQPAHQTCAVANGTDTAGRLASINVIVTCALAAHTIGGTVNNLTGTGLVLTNGTSGGTLAVAPAATAFKFPDANKVTFGVTYGVTVLTQPAGQTCTVVNGTGEMQDADVNNIVVNCI